MLIEEASRPRWWRSLLARVTIGYALGALLLSSLVALLTFTLVQNRLLSNAESQQRIQTFDNAIDVRSQLEALSVVEEVAETGPNDVSAVDIQPAETADGEEPATAEEAEQAVGPAYSAILEQLRRSTGSQAIILPADGSERSLTLKAENIPNALLATVSGAEGDTGADLVDAAHMRWTDELGQTSYWVGVRLESVEASYFERRPLDDVEATLGSLRAILLGVAAAASIGGAGLGFYSAKAALSPLPRISSAARSIAEGDFSTKLDLERDRDLAVLTEAFNDMVDAVSDRIEREQRFTSDVSHELRSPLQTLAASVEILERRKESLPEVAQQAIDLLSHDLHRFERLVEDLLEVSRMEAGAVQLQLTRFGLAEFLENVIFQSRSPGTELTYSEEDANVYITADKRRLAQVMSNLVENAEKYGGGATGVEFEVSGESVEIVVSDLGSGVPVNQRDRIFERFGRVEAGNRATAPGFGLGLSLVAEHVRLHGGSVWVTDRIDGRRGARFVVQLPLGEHVDILEEMAL